MKSVKFNKKPIGISETVGESLKTTAICIDNTKNVYRMHFGYNTQLQFISMSNYMDKETEQKRYHTTNSTQIYSIYETNSTQIDLEMRINPFTKRLIYEMRREENNTEIATKSIEITSKHTQRLQQQNTYT